MRPIENQRRMYPGSSDPMALRTRMVEETNNDDETMDDEILQSLARITDDQTRLAALDLLPDEMILRFHARGWQ